MSERFRGGPEDPNRVKKEIEEGIEEFRTNKTEDGDMWEIEERERWEEGERQREEERRVEQERVVKLIQSVEDGVKGLELTDVQRSAEETLNDEEKELIKEFDAIQEAAFKKYYTSFGKGFFPGATSRWISQEFPLSGADSLHYEKTQSTAPQNQSANTTEGVRRTLLELPAEKLRAMRAALFHNLCIMEAGVFAKRTKDTHYLKDEPTYWEAVDRSTLRNLVIREQIASGELEGRALYALPMSNKESGKFDVGYRNQSE